MSLVIPLGELPPAAFQLGPEIEDTQPRIFADQFLFEYVDSLTTSVMIEQGVIDVNQGLIEAHDDFTLNHQRRVGMLAGSIAIARGDSEHQIYKTIKGGVTHDNGKCACQGVVHSTYATLPPELEATKELHTFNGALRINRLLGDDEIEAVALGHHEFRDGAQYPDIAAEHLNDKQRALLVDEALMGAKGIVQVVALADAYDAITSRRPYKPASTPVEAFLALKAEYVGSHILIDELFEGVYGFPSSALEKLLAS